MKRALLGLTLALAAPLAAHAAFTATGKFLYVDRAFTFSGGFTGVEPSLPIRLATVQVINNATGAVLATGATNETGDVSISVGAGGTTDIVVRCFSRSNQFGGFSQRVTDGSNVEFSVSSAVFPAWNLNTNLAFGTVVAQKVIAAGNQGGPFNILDQMVSGFQYVKAQGAGNPPASLRVIWPGSGSFASGTTANIATGDGFDDLLQLHEFGHLIHDLYSDNDEPGGSHTFGESDQDPRLSLGEGWASFFGGAVRQFRGFNEPGFYLDCSGTGQTGGGSIQLRMRFEDGFPFTNTTGGEADEGAVFCALWDIIDTTATLDGNLVDDDPVNGSFLFNGSQTAEQMHWSVFTGPVNTAADLTIRNLWNGLFAPTDHGHHAELLAALDGWDMRFSNDVLEPNNTPATASAISLSPSWSATRTLYFSSANPPAPGEGDSDYYRFSATAGSTVSIETRYPGGNADAETYGDPQLDLLRPNGTLFATDNDGGTGRNALLANQLLDQSGTWTARVYTSHAYRRTGSYDLRAQLLSGPAGGCVNVATSSHFGVGKPGVNGIPQLIAATQPVIPSAFQMQIGSGPPSAAGLLFVGVSAIDLPFDGGHLYVTPTFIVPIATSPAGSLSLVPALSDPGACGATVHLQVIFPNAPGAAGPNKTAQSDRLTLTFGG